MESFIRYKPNARVRELNSVKKRMDERIDESVFLCFGHIKRMKGNRDAKRE